MANVQLPVKSEVRASITKTAQEQAFEEKRLQDMLLLVETMFLREETTVKLVLECLYDIGATNLINKRVRRRPLNQLAKLIVRYSKPLFRIVAWRWFMKNCPNLLVNWLHGKVSKF